MNIGKIKSTNVGKIIITNVGKIIITNICMCTRMYIRM